MLRHPKSYNPGRLAACRRSVFVLVAGVAFSFTMAAAQMSQPSTAQKPSGGSVRIRVNGTNGQPFEPPARVTLGNDAAAPPVMVDNGIADFFRVPAGHYTVTVQSPGYKDVTVDVEVSTLGMIEANVIMEVADDPETSLGQMGFVLAPKAQKELDDGVAAMRARKFDEAQKHLEAAYSLAPGNPNVNDILGEFFLATKDLPKAKQYFDRASSLDPANVRVLLDSGDVRIQQHDYAAAEPPLEKAIALAPQSQTAHWLLGVAYLDSRDYEKSRLEATTALKLSKGPASNAQYLLGESLAGLGRKDEAIAALQAFVQASPNAPYVTSAQTLISKLQSDPAEVNAPQDVQPTPPPPAPIAPAQ